MVPPASLAAGLRCSWPGDGTTAFADSTAHVYCQAQDRLLAFIGLEMVWNKFQCLSPMTVSVNPDPKTY